MTLKLNGASRKFSNAHITAPLDHSSITSCVRPSALACP
jgi:hypothetical protein